MGVASAREILQRHPKLKVAIIEKEEKLAVHQSGHNSGNFPSLLILITHFNSSPLHIHPQVSSTRASTTSRVHSKPNYAWRDCT